MMMTSSSGFKEVFFWESRPHPFRSKLAVLHGVKLLNYSQAQAEEESIRGGPTVESYGYRNLPQRFSVDVFQMDKIRSR